LRITITDILGKTLTLDNMTIEQWWSIRDAVAKGGPLHFENAAGDCNQFGPGKIVRAEVTRAHDDVPPPVPASEVVDGNV
jgi:hypothetical protein